MRCLVRFHPILIAIFISGFAVSIAAAETCFVSTIDGAQAGTGSPAIGTATYSLNDDQTELTYNITFAGLVGAETAAHIHAGAAGQNGPVVHALMGGSPKIGKWTNADVPPLSDFLPDLLANGLYVNIHSSIEPGGEIRGQINFSPCQETCFTASLDGTQSGTGSTATGTGLVSLNHTQTVLTYNLEFSGLLGSQTAAHIHNDGEGGAVVNAIPNGSPQVATWDFEDSPPLTPERVMDLMSDLMYFNVHSSLHPGGEIRGQIMTGPCEITCYSGPIDGAQANTPSTALGTAAATLNHTETRLTVQVTFSGLSSTQTAAHIHSDAEGGAVVRVLPMGSPLIATWTSEDSPPLNPTRVTDLKLNMHYINIHSSDFPGGEIRGQLIGGCPPTGISPDRAPRQALHQNYPNPFNPTTTIAFSLQSRAYVSLRIYDVNGGLVRTLIDEVRAAGADQTAVWDGTNKAGTPVASGVYFYRLVTPDFSATRKMVLLK